MKYSHETEGKFKYIETRGGEETILLLHGLFGTLSNFGGILDHFGKSYNVVVPILPIYEMALQKVSIGGLLDHVIEFVEHKGYDKVHVLGNSLGGHITLLYTLAKPERIASMTLTGSSGLFENSMGSSFPKRGDYEFIKTKTQATFYDPNVASQELIDEVFDIVNDRSKAIRVVLTAKSAIRHNIENRLPLIQAPTLLVWGKEDTITPPFTAEKFHEMIPDSRLIFIEKCGHAAMMEHPKEFNQHLEAFLKEVKEKY